MSLWWLVINSQRGVWFSQLFLQRFFLGQVWGSFLTLCTISCHQHRSLSFLCSAETHKVKSWLWGALLSKHIENTVEILGSLSLFDIFKMLSWFASILQWFVELYGSYHYHYKSIDVNIIYVILFIVNIFLTDVWLFHSRLVAISLGWLLSLKHDPHSLR